MALLRFLHGANQIDCGAVVVARLNNPRTLRNAEGFFELLRMLAVARINSYAAAIFVLRRQLPPFYLDPLLTVARLVAGRRPPRE